MLKGIGRLFLKNLGVKPTAQHCQSASCQKNAAHDGIYRSVIMSVMAVEQSRKIYRFGVFEADSGSGELRKSGVRMRVQDQPFQVLLVLLQRSGEVVTREDLRQKLWPSDTFVDFDHSLNTIVNKLREALGDSASNPRFIQTIAKRGYRFLISVEQTPDQQILPSSAEPVTTSSVPLQNEGDGDAFLTASHDVPAVHHGYVRILFLLIQVMYLCFYIVALARISFVEELLQQAFSHHEWVSILLIVSAAVGIPIRLYLLSAVSFDIQHLGRKVLRIFPATFLLDELWALSPFLLAPQIGMGAALAVTAALIYLPFAQRTLVLMRERSRAQVG
jgi:DNA-binding winged helix-turn-helix (wHTH) protein